MKVNTPQEHQGTPEQEEGVSAQVVETQWNRIIDKEDQDTGTRRGHQTDPAPDDRGDAMDLADPSMRSTMQIDSILPDMASPGQSVIIQGNHLGTTKKILFNDQEALFDVDGEVLVVQVPDGSGPVEVTVEGADGQSCIVKFTIE
jgi:IPT/TIG domain